jgi:hypothetical protein
MENHLKVLGIVRIVMGAFVGLVSLGMLWASRTMAANLDTLEGFGRSEASAQARLALVVTSSLQLSLVVVSIAGIVIGCGLLALRRWSRPLGIAAAILDLVLVPVGPIIGIYGLWVLLSADTKRLLAGKAALRDT